MAVRVIALANQKGGVGKTTTAINLAACVAAAGRRVLLIDLDPQCNATSGIGVEQAPGRSIYAALLGETKLADLVKETRIPNLHIVPSELDLAGAEIDIARAERYLHKLNDALKPVHEQNMYDFVFIDCPPSLGILTMNALTAAQSVIIPIQCEYYALEGLSVISRLLEQVRDGGANPRLELEGILMTMYDGRTNLSGQVVEEVRSHFADKIYENVIPRNVRLSEAPSFGVPAVEYDASCTGAVAYRKFAKEFLRRADHKAAGAQPQPTPQPTPPAPQPAPNPPPAP